MSNPPDPPESPRRLESIYRWPNKEDIEASSILYASWRTFNRVIGLQSFLRALYTTLLPKTLEEHGVSFYSLLWYPAAGAEYYGDNDIEPWRSPQQQRRSSSSGVHVPLTISSPQVQLRIVPAQNANLRWGAFRTSLRTNLGCLCSEQWKYKMATLGQKDTHWKSEAAHQIHRDDTWVLALDLNDIIERCKQHGPRDTKAVEEQIEAFNEDRVTLVAEKEQQLGEWRAEGPAESPRETSLGDRTVYVHDIRGDERQEKLANFALRDLFSKIHQQMSRAVVKSTEPDLFCFGKHANSTHILLADTLLSRLRDRLNSQGWAEIDVRDVSENSPDIKNFVREFCVSLTHFAYYSEFRGVVYSYADTLKTTQNNIVVMCLPTGNPLKIVVFRSNPDGLPEGLPELPGPQVNGFSYRFYQED